jgi:hypothetical protein
MVLGRRCGFVASTPSIAIRDFSRQQSILRGGCSPAPRSHRTQKERGILSIVSIVRSERPNHPGQSPNVGTCCNGLPGPRFSRNAYSVRGLISDLTTSQQRSADTPNRAGTGHEFRTLGNQFVLGCVTVSGGFRAMAQRKKRYKAANPDLQSAPANLATRIQFCTAILNFTAMLVKIWYDNHEAIIQFFKHLFGCLRRRPEWSPRIAMQIRSEAQCWCLSV